MTPAPPPDSTGDYSEVRCRYHQDTLDDHERRLRVVERFQWKLVGAISLASAGAAFLGALVEHFITK